MTKQNHQSDVDAIRPALNALTNDELEETLVINRRITPPSDSPTEILQDHALRLGLSVEILNDRRVAAPIEWPKCATAEDHAAGKKTMCQHVSVQQADGSIARFHCRVVVPDDGLPKVHHAPGWLGRTWRKFFPDLRAEEEIFMDRVRWLRAPD